MNETATALDIDTAARCRAFRALFATCGLGGSCVDDPGAAVALASLAGQFAWHAELCFELLPLRVGIDREALVQMKTPAADAALGVLAAAVERGDAATACALLFEVLLPRLAAGVAASLDATVAGLDGPRARALGLVGRDLDDAIERLGRLAARRGADDAAAGEVRSAVTDLERQLAEAGPDAAPLAVSGRGG